MNAVRKTMLLLGVATLLLCVPLTAAAEDDIFQSPLSVNSAIAATASVTISGTLRTTDQINGAVVPAHPSARRVSSERDSNFVLPDGRSHLRSFCLLRC
jgi:hypothetical protein